MARPKEFDQEKLFIVPYPFSLKKGFAATSTDDLMLAMDVARQSMYDTFRDKRALFLKALEVYVAESVRANQCGTPDPRVHPLLLSGEHYPLCRAQRSFQYRWFAWESNAVCEFGMRDEDVTEIIRSAARVQRHILMETLRRAQLEGELDAHTDIESLADFFDSTLAGMRIAAKAGKTRPALKRIAVVASIVFAGTRLSIL